MKTKPADKLYCGVDRDKIAKAKPTLDKEVLKWHFEYLTERHEIYKKKEIQKLPQKEWTTFEVFKNFRFTNIRRELDRESVWLIDNISTNPTLTLEEKLLWSILFRTYNKSSTFEKLGFPQNLSILDLDNDTIEEIRKVIDKEIEKDPKYVWFTPAFNTGGLKAIWAMPDKNIYECTSSEFKVKVVKK